MIRESKVIVSKTLFKGNFFNLRKIHFVLREKKWYDHSSISIWWKKNIGLGITGKPRKILKYFMIGVSFFRYKLWLDFTWVGEDSGPPSKFHIKD